MDQELRQKWIDALRSGKYTQGDSYLRSGQDEYCCLGVLCDLVNPKDWYVGDDASEDFYYYKGTIDGKNAFGALPDYVSQQLEFTNLGYFEITQELIAKLALLGLSNKILYWTEGRTETLTKLNDDGWSFEEIAHVIEHAEFLEWKG